ncbi:ankyrin-3 isoform X1 [Anopheles darlingi]|uniref:ankyrin-3 isoform X1 n=1 Tax=Anopheles darlingi TaxID=43151 RepID=UPI0020FFF7DB|nr:ankyrin-3 isoform X1 [Anopheles darlingi]XP_049547696.1 ankyrin-3 isoform X1 [Anopheles darlingi]
MALEETQNNNGSAVAVVPKESVPQPLKQQPQQQQQQQQGQAQIQPSTSSEKLNNIVNGGGGAALSSDKSRSNNKQNDTNTAFLRAARAGDLPKLIEYLETGQVTDINTCNANGLNALHLAAKDGHYDIVNELLKRGANVDNATKKGNTALHIASLAGQKDIIHLLLQYNASVNVQSQNGFTPLYMAAQENHDECVNYLLAKGANPALATEDGFTPLAVAMQQGHDKVVAVLLESDTRGKVRLPALHIAAKKDDVKAAKLLLENEHNPDVSSKSGFTPLHIAAHYGNVNVAQLLIEKGADANFTAKHNITPLHVACKWGKLNMVKLLIANHARIDSITRDGLTPLHCAARSGHDQVIEVLLEQGAEIISKTKNGLAPLHMAAQGEHVSAARILLMNKSPVDDITIDYLTALHVAAHCGHVKVAKLLLDRNADPNARALNGFTPLHIACKKNRIKVVELLLNHGATIGATTESGLTPLHVASFMGCMNIVIYLLQHDASPDIPTVRGETPLHLAARAKQTDIIRILLRNGAYVNAQAREDQTPLHVASRIGNMEIVMLLLQHGAKIDANTKDNYTPLHIAAKEGQDEVAALLLDNEANVEAVTKKGFTPLHLAAKYGNLKCAELLLERGAQVDVQGKNGVTPLHVASHYDNQKVALLLLEKGASPYSPAKNGHTPLHIASKKNQLHIATTLLEYKADANAESKTGFTPLHLSAQEGHSDMARTLLENGADPNHAAKNGLTPLHLCAQEDHVGIAETLLEHKARIDPVTKTGFTPLHVAAHFGQAGMVKYLIENDANIEMKTNIGHTPLHQAAQQGHTLIINILLKNKANPEAVTNSGQTALSIADKLGYITVVETLKVVTETSVTQTVDEKFKIVGPETIHETFLSDSEDEGGPEGGSPSPTATDTKALVQAQHLYGGSGAIKYYQSQMRYTREDPIMSDQQQYNYMTSDENKQFDDTHLTNMSIDPMKDDKYLEKIISRAENYTVSADRSHTPNPLDITVTDNVNITRKPIHVGAVSSSDALSLTIALANNLYGGDRKKFGPLSRERFLVSFLVDARGGAMRGCRHSGVRVIVPPRSAAQPTRITCRYVKPQRITNGPPLMEGEALVSRILELAPVGAKFLGPVILEVPHFASLRDKEREIIILRSDNGETWREHTLYDSEEAIHDVLNETFKGDTLNFLEDLHTNRITRVLTNDFPHYFAIVSRIRQEVHAIGPEGGTVSATAVPQVQAIFPQNALTKKIRVGLQAQPIDMNTTANLLGRSVAVSPVVTVEPRRRKFHKAITLSMPAPKAYNSGMINQYSGNAPTLRLLCSITGGQNKAVWEDVTGSTPLTFVNDCVSFTTTVSARFWLMDCRNISEATKMATELYSQMAHVPFMVKFVVFAKRVDQSEAKLSVFLMTDDKEDKTLEHQEHFTEIAKSRDVEVCEGRTIYLEFAGNIVPVQKSGEQLALQFNAFKENRLTFTVKIRNNLDDLLGRISFMNEPKVAKGEPIQTPLCTLNFTLPPERFGLGGDELETTSEFDRSSTEILNGEQQAVVAAANRGKTFAFAFQNGGSADGSNEIHKADIKITDICNLIGSDWPLLAEELSIAATDVDLIKTEYPNDEAQQAIVMLRLWLRQAGKDATGNVLEQALIKINRPDIVNKSITNLEPVTDEYERKVAQRQLGSMNGLDEIDPAKINGVALASSSMLEDSTHEPTEEKQEHEDVEKHKQQPSSGENGGSPTTPSPDTIEAFQQIRRESEILGIAAVKKEDLSTPPPSPADFSTQVSQNSQTSAEERHDVAEDVQEIIQQAIKDHDTHEEEDEQEEKEEEDDDTSVKHPAAVVVASADDGGDDSEGFELETDKSGKVKTIKKHSKVNIKINKTVAQRPTVGDIEWDANAATDSQPQPQIEISSVNLEDVSNDRRYSLDHIDPVAEGLSVGGGGARTYEKSHSTPGQTEQKAEQIVIISSDNNISEVPADYSGDIDEFIFVQTSPENYAKMEKEQAASRAAASGMGTDDDDNSNLVIITEEHYDYEMTSDEDRRSSSVLDPSPPEEKDLDDGYIVPPSADRMTDDSSSPVAAQKRFIVGGSSSDSEDDHNRHHPSGPPTAAVRRTVTTTTKRTKMGPSSGITITEDETVVLTEGDSIAASPSITVSQPPPPPQQPPSSSTSNNFSIRTGGSSSGSDVALHEAAGELSDDDETGKVSKILFPDVTESDKATVEPDTTSTVGHGSSSVSVIVTQVSHEETMEETDQEEEAKGQDEQEPPVADELLADISYDGGGDDDDDDDSQCISLPRAVDGGDGTGVLVQTAAPVAGHTEGSVDIKNFLVQNNDQPIGMEPSEPPTDSELAKSSKRTETNTFVDESDDGIVRTTVITTTTTLTSGDEIPEDLEEQLLKQLRDQQLLQEQQQQTQDGTPQTVIITTTTSDEDPDTGAETTSTSTTRVTTTTKTITLTPDGDFPEDELLQKITTTTTQTSQPNVPEMVKETTVTVTEMVDGRTLEGAAKTALNSIVDDFMNQERKN